MELAPTTLLKDRYRIREKLAAGGMGAVYMAHDTALDALVAIKANINPGEHSARQFLREAKLLAALRHLNLPRVTDYFVLEGIQYLVMDFVPGEDLSERLKREGPQHVDRVLDWANQLGQALTYLHTQDPPIIHRDIKPSNIKLTPQGQLILVDFGIAKSSASGGTTTGSRGLTPGFAPPEQYGSGSTTPATDQYALAATLYNLLTGQAPAEAVQRMLGKAKLTAPREILPRIPLHLDSALRRALAIQPEDRFASVAAFTQALGDPSYTYQASQLPTIKAPKQKAGRGARPGLPLAIGAIAVLALAAAAYLFWPGGDSPATTDPGTLEASATLPSSPLAFSPTEAPSPSAPLPGETPTASPSPAIQATPIGGGPRIAFVSNRADGRTFQIFTMRPDGSDLTQLTFSEGSKSQPTWSPDGRQLLFAAQGGRDEFGADLGLDIWRMDEDGGNITNLTQNPGDDYDPAWSPDGEKIIFTATRVNDLRQLFMMNADGSEQEFISRGYGVEFAPNWSPDGEWIAFTISINGAPPRLFLRTGEGVDPRPFDLSQRLGQVNDPAWSPDGLTIVYTCVDPGQNEICLVVVDSKGAEIFLYTNTLGNKEPAWSPDGRWIAFTSTRDQNSEIYIMDSLGRGQTNITNHPSTDREPSWQPQP